MGVVKYTQTGFESGDEKKYVATLESILAGGTCDVGSPTSRPASRPWPAEGAAKAGAQSMLFYTTSSTDAPHRAVLPFVFAVKAKEKGHDAAIFLAGDATLLMKSGVLGAVRAPGQPDAESLMKRAIELRVPIFL